MAHDGFILVLVVVLVVIKRQKNSQKDNCQFATDRGPNLGIAHSHV